MESKQSRNEYLRRIYKVQDYIESNINDSLSIEELADVAGFSKFHFHRIFKGIVNESLSRYVNRLKLEKGHTSTYISDRYDDYRYCVSLRIHRFSSFLPNI